MPGGKGGAQRVNPWTKEDRAAVIDPLVGTVKGLGQTDIGALQKSMESPYRGQQLEGQAADILMGMNPTSWMQGGQGYLGQAGGLFNLAQNAVGGDPLGAKSMFQQFLSPQFSDVQNNPQVQANIQAAKGAGQEFLNQALQGIQNTSGMASGGVGHGSGAAIQAGQAGARASDLFSRNVADIMMNEQARRQGLQLAAGQQGLAYGNQNAELLGQLGSQLGQLGLGAGTLGGNLLGQQIAGLSDLGSRFVGRETTAQMLPWSMGTQLGDLLKSTTTAYKPGWLDTVQGVAGAAGSVMGGIGAV